jgi:hypothetical protein
MLDLGSLMHSYPFIFSKKYWFQRHFLFWFCWWGFQSVLYSFVVGLASVENYKRLPISSVEALVYLIPHMFLAYSLMYVVVPKLLLRSKYLATAFAVIAVFILTGVISACIGVYFLEDIRHFILPRAVDIYHPRPVNMAFFLSLLAGLRGAITIGGMAAAIKLMKYWYIKEQNNLQLQKENSESQLQLLKAQVHPHFLFNTLNNIYAYTQSTSPVASTLVMGLSDMLRYMLYECNQRLVPLSKELKMLEDYILLEKIRYGNTLDVHIDIPPDAGKYLVAPLLLLPFVENSFKHGASQILDQPWLSLHVAINDDTMTMKLVNAKAENYAATSSESGIGIQNVRRRLELLYPNQFVLKITDEGEVFIVDLKLRLEKSAASSQKFEPGKKVVIYE